MAERVGYDDPSRYLNSGVLLIDCAALKEDAELFDQFVDIAAASSAPVLMDNEWLIQILRGKVTWLPPIYNSMRGNLETALSFLPKRFRDYYSTSREDPAIAHFTGKNKPWDEEHTETYLLHNPFLKEYQSLMKDCDALLGS